MANETRVKVGSNPSVQVSESTTIVKKVVVGTPIRAVDAARFDATTLDGESASYYLNADNFINLPEGLQNIRDIDSGVAITGITRIEGTIVPAEDRRYNLGTPTKRFGSIYLEGETLYVGNLSVSDAGDGKMQTAEASFTGDVDSQGNPIAELSNIKVVSTLDSAQVIDMINRWVRDTDGDSNGGPGLNSWFDSAYVQARVDETFLDDLIDSDFVARNLDKLQIEEIIAKEVDSATIASKIVNLVAAVNQDLQDTNTTIVDAFATDKYRTMKYVIQLEHDSDSKYHSTEILLTHNGIHAYLTEYAIVQTDSSLGEFDARIQSGNVELTLTPSYTNTSIKAKRISIDA